MQIWQLEGQNTQKHDGDFRDFRILKRLPQTTTKLVEICVKHNCHTVKTVSKIILTAYIYLYGICGQHFFVGFFLDDWCIRTATNVFDQLWTLDPEKSVKSGNPNLEKNKIIKKY